MTDELNSFENYLKTKSVEFIIDRAYAYTVKTELLGIIEHDEILDKDDAKKLLTYDSPLDKLYQDWLDNDFSILDALRDSIRYSTENLEPETKTFQPNKNKNSILGKLREGAKKAQSDKTQKSLDLSHINKTDKKEIR